MRSFDLSATLGDTSIRLGKVLGGECVGGEPVVFVREVVNVLTERDDRYPRTYGEFLEYGAQLPDTIVEERDILVGCSNYQKAVRSEVVVQTCITCPSLKAGQ